MATGLERDKGGEEATAGLPEQARPAPYRARKDHVSAGLLAIFLGALGMHKFYLGYFSVGFIMMAVTVLGSLLTFGVAGIVMFFIGVAEGIVYLATSPADFQRDYVEHARPWF